MAIDLDSILDRKSAVDRAFKQGRSKPWRVYTEERPASDIANNELTNSKQPANKQLTNNKQITNNQLTDMPDKNMALKANSKQTVNNQLTNNKQSANKTDLVPVKSADEFLQILHRLSNQQKKLFLYIHERCLENGDRASGPISSHIFSSIIASNNNTVRTQLQRLIEKNLLCRLPGKPGRGGFHAYSMSHSAIKAGNEFRRYILKELEGFSKNPLSEIANNQLTISKQTTNTIANNEGSSSSSNLIKTTTTREPDELELCEEKIDISPLEKIGFTYSHVTQIRKRTQLTPEVIQASINHFAFDLKENSKAGHLKSSPLNFFMGILVKGIPYNPPENFEDEKSRALRAFLEKQKELQENLAKLEDEAKDQAFEQWYVQLDDEKKQLLLPPILRGKSTSEKSKKLSLNGHFIEYEWPILRGEIIKRIKA